MSRVASVVVVACCLVFIVSATHVALAQEGSESARKVVHRVTPTYPDLARRMSITGSVKLEVTVAANGSPKNPKVVGGHPLLVQSAIDAINEWRWAPGQETKEFVEFKFSPPE
jgi:TonB family protein